MKMNAEEKWIRSLSRVLKDMPKTLEISMTQTDIEVHELGSVDAELDRSGDMDNVESIKVIRCDRVYPRGEAL